MTKCQIRDANYLITVQCVQKTAWNISVYFDPTEIEFNLSSFYVYQISSYSRVYIRHNKMTYFI